MLKFRLWPTLAMIVVVAVTVRLGFWQRDRAHQKEALASTIARYAHAPPVALNARPVPLREIEYHRVLARGRYLPQQAIYLENRPHEDRAGFYVVMPMALEGGGAVLVNRGWLPRDPADRTTIGPFRTPTGVVDVIGVARATPPRTFQLGHDKVSPAVHIRQNIEPRAFAQETGLPLQPFVIDETDDAHDGLIRAWPAPDTGVDRNYGYMVQWWAIGLTALLFGLYAARRTARPGRRSVHVASRSPDIKD